jgi:hypothetical protein
MKNPVGRSGVVSALGVAQIFAWGASYYLPAVTASAISADTGWPLYWVVGGLSIGLTSGAIVSPLVGRTINDQGGRLVLCLSSIALALGLFIVAASQNLAIYFVGWAIIGLGMGAGLYDAAFSTLGGLYGQAARSAISTVTLFGGFASTICWPLTALLLEHVGWRGACVAYAMTQLIVCLPLYAWALPQEGDARPSLADHASDKLQAGVKTPHFVWLLGLLGAVNLLISAIGVIVSVQLVELLRSAGAGLAAAVGLAALIGPAQVVARLFERAIGGWFHPAWILALSSALVAAGSGLLASGLSFAALALMIYGAGAGLHSIARGATPLALFGSGDYALTMGKLAAPVLMAQALAPVASTLLLASHGADTVLYWLAIAALVALALSCGILIIARRRS